MLTSDMIKRYLGNSILIQMCCCSLLKRGLVELVYYYYYCVSGVRGVVVLVIES